MKLSQLLPFVMLTGCATAQPPDAALNSTQAAICSPGVSLGRVAIAPLTRWRTDQKEPEVREAIAEKAVAAIAETIPCASSATVLPVAPDSASAGKLADAQAAGATTALLIRIDELGPIAILSFPALWSTWSDVKFTVDIVDVASSEVKRSIPHHRRKGGAFEIRGLEPLQGEMEQALKDVINGPNN